MLLARTKPNSVGRHAAWRDGARRGARDRSLYVPPNFQSNERNGCEICQCQNFGISVRPDIATKAIVFVRARVLIYPRSDHMVIYLITTESETSPKPPSLQLEHRSSQTQRHCGLTYNSANKSVVGTSRVEMRHRSQHEYARTQSISTLVSRSRRRPLHRWNGLTIHPANRQVRFPFLQVIDFGS
jgi:hypothetical protein